MPKFEKGSQEAKDYMASIRRKKQSKSNEPHHQKIKEVVLDAIDKYFLAGSAVIEVPDKVVKIDNKGTPQLIDTLTKKGNLKKVDKENVIQLVPNYINSNITIKNVGQKIGTRGKKIQNELFQRAYDNHFSNNDRIKEVWALETRLNKTKKPEKRDALQSKINEINEGLEQREEKFITARDQDRAYSNDYAKRRWKKIINDAKKTI